MSDKKNDTENTEANVRELARKIWLAGLGAYGRAFSEGRDMLKTASERGSEVFEDLVARGETLEDDVDDKARSMMEEVRSQVSDLNLDERISRMRDRIKREGRSAAKDMESRVDMLERRLQDILDAIEGKPDAKTQAKTARKATTKKTTTQRTTKKAPAKKAKAPAKTTTAKKTTAKTAPKSGKTASKKPTSSKPKS